MSNVLFVSQNPLERAENLKAVWDAFEGAKTFRHGVYGMSSAERDGFDVVVCDCLPVIIEGKRRVKSVNIGHGITGDKLYGLDEGRKPWVSPVAFSQTDYAIAASEASVPMVAGQLGILEERALPLGFPRTDRYFGTFPEPTVRTYLYAPTFRNGDGRLPRIDWDAVDNLLSDDELLIVKRHYATPEPVVGRNYPHVMEVPPTERSTAYLAACSVVITDYSSIMFDGYILGKPSVLLIDDMEEYLKKRGMYRDYPIGYSSRWLVAEGNEERLVNELREAAVSGMRNIERRCLDEVAGACDGHSTERVCKLVEDLLEGR